MSFKRKAVITVHGDTDADIDYAISEASRLIDEGYLSGLGENESGSYEFTVVINPVTDQTK